MKNFFMVLFAFSLASTAHCIEFKSLPEFFQDYPNGIDRNSEMKEIIIGGSGYVNELGRTDFFELKPFKRHIVANPNGGPFDRVEYRTILDFERIYRLDMYSNKDSGRYVLSIPVTSSDWAEHQYVTDQKTYNKLFKALSLGKWECRTRLLYQLKAVMGGVKLDIDSVYSGCPSR